MVGCSTKKISILLKNDALYCLYYLNVNAIIGV